MECPISQRKKILALETQIQMLQKEKKKPKQDSQKDGGKEGFRKSKKQKKKEKELSKWMKVPPFNANKDKPKTIKARSTYGVPSLVGGADTSPLHARARAPTKT